MTSSPELSVERRGTHRVISGLGRPFGIGHDRDGNILIADMDLHGIARLSDDLCAFQWLDGLNGWTPRKHTRVGRSARAGKRAAQTFDGPHSVTCHADGRIFVTTYYTPGLFVLDAAGKMIRNLSPKRFSLKGPATTTLAGDGSLLVSEYVLNGIFKFTAEGEFVGALGGGEVGFRDTTSYRPGTEAGAFDRPHMAIATATGDIVVADTWNHRLQSFSKDGNFQGLLGGTLDAWDSRTVATPAGSSTTSFHAPVAICSSQGNGLLVTDWGNNRIKQIDALGAAVDVQDDLGLDRPYDAQLIGNGCFIANSHLGEVIVQTRSA